MRSDNTGMTSLGIRDDPKDPKKEGVIAYEALALYSGTTVFEAW